MNRTKWLTALLCVLLCMTTLAACFSGGEDGSTSRKKGTTAPEAGGDYFPEMASPLAEFVIRHNGETVPMRTATYLANEIQKATGVELDVIRGASDESTAQIVIAEGSNLGDGAWTIAVAGTTITVSAKDYYGYSAAVEYFKKSISKEKTYPFKDGYFASGDYISGATGVYTSTKYAFDRQGEHRVMFYNVLFKDTATSWDGSTQYSIPAAARDELQAEMVAVYLPDVLGCQEFDSTRRGGATDGAGGLSGLLREMGYAETVDPRVKNAYSKSEKIPGTDASLTVEGAEPGTLLDGYGTSGATKVNYGNVTYTYYNCTPLFYNTATTKLIASEYYWYKSQWDRKVEENVSMPSGWSKSATWGVFESLETGERYAVISTHMCTRSDFIRGLQAEEIESLVNRIVSEYGCPVFLGGDLNGNLGDANYDHFVEAGYRSLQDNALGTVHTSAYDTMHGYPSFDSSLGMMTPGLNTAASIARIQQRENKNSIDQIFSVNGTGVAISVFGVVVDDMTLSGSDHLPTFTDFSLDLP